MTHLSNLEVKVLTDVVAKHKSGELRCPATALITNGNQKTLNVFLLPMVPLVDHMVEFLSY